MNRVAPLFALALAVPAAALAQLPIAPLPIAAGAEPEVAASPELELLLPVVDDGAPRADAELRPLADTLARARDLDARADFEGAAARYETYARGCLRSSIAILGRRHTCASAANALERAFELRRALAQRQLADLDAREHVAHFLYARPRAAARVAYARARMHAEAGAPRDAEAALSELEGQLDDPTDGQLVIIDALRAHIASAEGNDRRAALLWRRVERRFVRADLEADGAVPASWVTEVVAEGRLARAEASATRFLAIRAPRGSVDDPSRWWTRTMSPWLVRARRRLLLAQMQLERVYELGSPQHSVRAAARIGDLYQRWSALHDALRMPDDEWLQTLVREGRDRPGYDQARSHYETCVRWAWHHGVARDTARRCEEGLHALDPVGSPLPSELHGASSYLPRAVATPAALHP